MRMFSFPWLFPVALFLCLPGNHITHAEESAFTFTLNEASQSHMEVSAPLANTVHTVTKIATVPVRTAVCVANVTVRVAAVPVRASLRAVSMPVRFVARVTHNVAYRVHNRRFAPVRNTIHRLRCN